MSFTIVIPARLDSKRLPNKVLLPLAGRTIIEHVIDRAKSSRAARIIVATDNEKVCAVAEKNGVESVMTNPAHTTGTDRILEACEKLRIDGDEIIINVQGDEPEIPTIAIDYLASQFKGPMSTLIEPMRATEAMSPHRVKVALTEDNRALYFSRAPIPFARDAANEFFRHIGVYAYTRSFLTKYCSYAPTKLESLEKLEQLRVLEMGYPIYCVKTPVSVPVGIDTMEDYRRLVEA